MSKRSTDLAMSQQEIDQLREVWVHCESNATEAAKALGINRETFTRALAGLPVLGVNASYLRMTLPRTLAKMRRNKVVSRTG